MAKNIFDQKVHFSPQISEHPTCTHLFNLDYDSEGQRNLGMTKNSQHMPKPCVGIPVDCLFIWHMLITSAIVFLDCL